MSLNNGLPADVTRFLDAHIGSVAQLEVLLLLRSRTGLALTAGDVGRDLRIDEGWAAAELHQLAGRDLLVEHPGTPPTYRFASSPALDAIGDAYARRRVTVINLILAKPSGTVRVFADAFRLRKG